MFCYEWYSEYSFGSHPIQQGLTIDTLQPYETRNNFTCFSSKKLLKLTLLFGFFIFFFQLFFRPPCNIDCCIVIPVMHCFTTWTSPVGLRTQLFMNVTATATGFGCVFCPYFQHRDTFSLPCVFDGV